MESKMKKSNRAHKVEAILKYLDHKGFKRDSNEYFKEYLRLWHVAGLDRYDSK